MSCCCSVQNVAIKEFTGFSLLGAERQSAWGSSFITAGWKTALRASLGGKDVFSSLLTGFDNSLVKHCGDLQLATSNRGPSTNRKPQTTWLSGHSHSPLILIGVRLAQSPSKHFLWVLSIMNSWDKSKGFTKPSTWSVSLVLYTQLKV